MIKIILCGIGIVGLGVGVNVWAAQKDAVLMHKYDACVVEMQKAIPDPNDTEARATFLKDNC